MDSEFRRAAAAWCAAGKPYIALQSMRGEEIKQLASLVNDNEKPLPDFRANFGAFYSEYLDNRKTTETPCLPCEE